MSNKPSGITDRKQAEDLISLLVADQKPIGPVRGEIMTLAREIARTLPSSQQERVRQALNTLSQEITPETPPAVRNLFAGTTSELMQAAPDIANIIIEERLKGWKGPPLNNEQRTHIKLAVIARMSQGEFINSILTRVEGGISALSKGMKDIFSPGKIEEIAKQVLNGSKEASGGTSLESKITEEIMKMVDAGLGEIQKAHESSPQPERYNELLQSPDALSRYTFGMNISNLLSGSVVNQNAFEEGVRGKLGHMDKKLIGMEKGKDQIFDILAKIPEIGSDRIIESLKWLFSIPIFGAFARGFLGLNTNEDPVETLKIETRERRSIAILKEFGKSAKYSSEIPLLRDIDLSTLRYRDLRPFFRTMRENSIDTSQEDFWKKVFIDGKIPLEKEGKKNTFEFPKWENGKESLTTILMKLNTLGKTPIAHAPRTSPLHQAEGISPQPIETDRLSLIKKGLEAATSLPFRAGNEEVSFLSGELKFGNARYKLEGVGMLTVGIESLSLQGSTIILGHRFGKSEVSKSDVIDVLPELLALSPGNKTEVRGEDGTLRITRST